MKRALFLSLLLIGSLALYAKNHTTFAYISKIEPAPNSKSVDPNASIVFTFDREVVKRSVGKNSITVKRVSSNTEIVEGEIRVEENRVSFTPYSLLKKGVYSVNLKPLKLKDRSRENPTWWQKLLAWLCSLFYENVADSPLCVRVCIPGIMTKPIHFRFEVEKVSPEVVSLESNISLVKLSENSSTKVKLIAEYDDNSTEDVTQKAKYESSDENVAKADKGEIFSKSEGSATITAAYADKKIEIAVEVYEKVDGHLLPHEPKDPDATLLGVDANKNGVRDDVERWIYKEMPTYHHPQIERVVAMTEARALQMVLEDPTNKDDLVNKASERASNCYMYYSYSRKLPFDGSSEKFINRLLDKQFNTKERLKTYFEYDYSLAGRVFTSTPLRLLDTTYCDQNIDILP